MKQDMASIFKVLSDKNRLEIIELLLKGETCGCTLIDKLPISQPTLSYHLKLLTESGLAYTKRDGNKTNHYINKDTFDDIIQFLTELKNTQLDACHIINKEEIQ